MDKMAMLKAYEQTNAATSVVFGFFMNDGEDVYALKAARLPAELIVVSRENSKKGATPKLKIGQLSDTKRNKLLSMGARFVGKACDVIGNAKNRGDAFEYYIARAWYNQPEHKKDSIPYWKKADIETNTERVSVKFEYASLANEITIMNGLKALTK